MSAMTKEELEAIRERNATLLMFGPSEKYVRKNPRTKLLLQAARDVESLLSEIDRLSHEILYPNGHAADITGSCNGRVW
jgi:hypothetical protein